MTCTPWRWPELLCLTTRTDQSECCVDFFQFPSPDATQAASRYPSSVLRSSRSSHTLSTTSYVVHTD